jgi:hypothetical protein
MHDPVPAGAGLAASIGPAHTALAVPSVIARSIHATAVAGAAAIEVRFASVRDAVAAGRASLGTALGRVGRVAAPVGCDIDDRVDAGVGSTPATSVTAGVEEGQAEDEPTRHAYPVARVLVVPPVGEAVQRKAAV